MTVTGTPDPQVDTPVLASSDLLPRRFVLRVVNENIVDTDADCIVVNHYAGPVVTGAALEVNAHVNNAILHNAARGELDAPSGRLTFIPARRSPLVADVVAVLSMGQYEEFTKLALEIEGTEEDIVGSLQSFGRNMAIACCDAEQRDVATVTHGAGETSQIAPDVAAKNLLIGYWRGVQQCGKEGAAYSLTLVEKKTAKCDALVNGVIQAIQGELQNTLALQRQGRWKDPTGSGEDRSVAYTWIGELNPTPNGSMDMPPQHLRLGIFALDPDLLKLTVFGDSGADQAVEDAFQAERIADAQERLRLFNQLVPPYINRQRKDLESTDPEIKRRAQQNLQQIDFEVRLRVEVMGQLLFDQIFNEFKTNIIRSLVDLPTAQNLLLRLDRRTVSIPWEMMADEDGIFGLTREVGRQMELPTMARNYMVPKPARDRVLRMLLVSNPTNDLPGVEDEAKRIVRRLRDRAHIDVEITHLHGEKATPNAVLSRVRGADYDVFHFAGHAQLNQLDPSQSGLLMANGQVLTVESISRMHNPPALVFFNACESADTKLAIPEKYAADLRSMNLLDKETDPLSKLSGNGSNGANGSGANGKGMNGSNGAGGNGAGQGASPEAETDELVSRFFGQLSVNMVGTLLRAGITNFVGTTWPVDDSAASWFAVAFYAHLADGGTVGEAMRAARHYVIKRMGYGHLGWASYVLYGAPWNRIV